jgi:hypothetical protein
LLSLTMHCCQDCVCLGCVTCRDLHFLPESGPGWAGGHVRNGTHVIVNSGERHSGSASKGRGSGSQSL